MLEKIVSGGQTGADQAGLFAALKAGIAAGGRAPRGWKTEAGPTPWLAEYGLEEHASADYPPRTRANVRDSDATLILCGEGEMGRGTKLTVRTCEELGKSCMVVFLDGSEGWSVPPGNPRGASRRALWCIRQVR